MLQVCVFVCTVVDCVVCVCLDACLFVCVLCVCLAGLFVGWNLMFVCVFVYVPICFLFKSLFVC